MRRTHALALAALLSLGAAPVAASARLDPISLKRLLVELRGDGTRLMGETESYLARSGRWEPSGADRDLWLALRAVEESIDGMANRYSLEPYPGMEDDVRALLERGASVEERMAGARVGERVRRAWSEVRDDFAELAGAYGWDYEAGRFDVTAAAPGAGEDPGGDLDPAGGGGRLAIDELYPERGDDDLAAFGRRFTRSDDLAVQAGLSQLDHLVRSLHRQYLVRGDAVPAEAPAGEERADPGAATEADLEWAAIEADLTALEGAAGDAQRQFALTRRAADVALEVAPLVALGRRVDSRLRRRPDAGGVGESWLPVQEKLNALAVVFELELIGID